MALPSPLKSEIGNRKTKIRRGGQPGNLNARTHGAYSLHSPSVNSILLHRLDELKGEVRSPSLPLHRLLAVALEQRDRLEARLDEASSLDEILVLLDLRFDLSAALSRLQCRIADVGIPRLDLLHEALSPLKYIRSELESRCISRDADSFFPVSATPAADPLSSNLPAAPHSFFQLFEESTINSPSFLTAAQCLVLAPLIPADPVLDHVYGEPPALIAANRWNFVEEASHSLAASAALEKYRRLTQPSVINEIPAKPAGSKRGRPFNSPLPLLDGIFWKLATGRGWSDLPSAYPPSRICQLCYRRLFRSGRLYTLLLALYDDYSRRSSVDPASLVRKGRLSLDSRSRAVLSPGAPDTWEARTSLLFLQLAHAAHRSLKKLARNGIIFP